MATRREILEANLEGEVLEKAIKNATEHWGEDGLDREPTVFGQSIYMVLATGFIWSDTPEGEDYWGEKALEAENNQKTESDE